MFGPVLTGKLVTLRPPDETDPLRFVEWLADLEVTHYLLNPHRAVALFQEEVWFKKVGEATDEVVWMIEAEGRAIGSTGIHRIDWHHGHGITGIVIGDKAAWGRGYASEAMELRTDYAFRQLNLHKLSSQAYMENDAAKRALSKAGYRQIGVAREELWGGGRWHDLWLAEVLRADWERARRG